MPRRRPPSRKEAAPPPTRALPAALAPFATLAAAMPEAALLTAGEWRQGGVDILFANERFAALTGYTGDAAGNTRALHGPRTGLEVLQHGRREDSRDPFALRGEGWLCRRDGTEFYAAWAFTPLPGDAAGCNLAVYRDITEMRRLQDALLHSQKLDTVGQLAGGVAHDFNNLLSVINGYCEILRPKVAGEPAARRDLEEIHRAGLKAATVARQILEFSRRSEPESRVVNCNVLIREIAGILRRALGDEIALELRLASDLGNTRADPTQFQQALLNLGFNARDALPRGGKVTVRTANRTLGADAVPGLRAGDYVSVRVSDNGSGIAPEVRRRLFEPFFTTKPQGTGLGLSTVRDFVGLHGGAVTVESEPGRGTTFELLLPETAEAALTFSTALPVLPAVRGSETVLVVEEDEVLRKLISGILTTDGYRVHHAPTAAEAGALVRTQRLEPQLLVVDSSAAAAADLALGLRESHPRLRVLSLSLESPAAALRSFRPGTVAHLPKPFALSTLLRMVRSVLDHGLH